MKKLMRGWLLLVLLIMYIGTAHAQTHAGMVCWTLLLQTVTATTTAVTAAHMSMA